MSAFCHSPNSRDGQRRTREQSFGQCLLTGKEKEPERIIIEMTAEELIGICPSVVYYNENYTVQFLEISKTITLSSKSSKQRTSRKAQNTSYL